MEDLHFLNREQELAQERCRKHVGTASIQLELLDFQHEVDEDNVERLVELMQAPRCDRTDIRNHVIATIDEQSLDAALRYSKISADMLVANAVGSYPILDFPPGIRLECLHGVDRLAAARRVLPSGDKRWTVDLYSAGIFSFSSDFCTAKSNFATRHQPPLEISLN